MKVCKEGKFATKLESNTIYLGKSNDKYHCPAGQCAELGSYARPCRSIKEAFDVLAKRYDDSTPVTLCFAAGDYNYDDEAPKDAPNQEVKIPSNNVGWAVPIGKIVVRGMHILIKDSDFKIENATLEGNINIIDGEDGTRSATERVGQCTTKSFEGKNITQLPDAKDLVKRASCAVKAGDLCQRVFTANGYKNGSGASDEEGKLDIVGNVKAKFTEAELNNISVLLKATGVQKGSCSIENAQALIKKLGISTGGNGKFSAELLKVEGQLEEWLSEATNQSEVKTKIENSQLSSAEKDSLKCMFNHLVSDDADVKHTLIGSDLLATIGKDCNVTKADIQKNGKLLLQEIDSVVQQNGDGGIFDLSAQEKAKVELVFNKAKAIVQTGQTSATSKEFAERNPWKLHNIKGQSVVSVSAQDADVDAADRKSVTKIVDEAKKAVKAIRTKITSMGKQNELTGSADHNSDKTDCNRSSGRLGSKFAERLEGRANRKESRRGGKDEMSPEDDGSKDLDVKKVFAIETNDDATYEATHEGVQNLFVNITSNVAGRQVTSGTWAEEIRQNGNSRVRISRRNNRVECRGMGHRIKILKDFAQNFHNENGQELNAYDLPEDQSVYDNDADDDVGTTFNGESNTSRVQGGIFAREVRKGRSQSTNNDLLHNLEHVPRSLLEPVKTFISEFSGDASERNIGSNNILKSLGTLRTQRFTDRARSNETSTNSLEEAPTLHDKIADAESRIESRHANVEHIGRKTSRGHVFQILDQVLGIGELNHETGKDGERQGQVGFVGGSHRGLVNLREALPLTSNYNKFNGGEGPAFRTFDTDHSHLLSEISTIRDGAAIESTHNKNRPAVKIAMQTASIGSLAAGVKKKYLVKLLGELHDEVNFGSVSSSHDLIAEYIGNDPAAKARSRSHFNLNIGGSTTPGKLKNFILDKLSTDLVVTED